MAIATSGGIERQQRLRERCITYKLIASLMMQLEKLAPRVAAGDRNLGMLFTWISVVLGSQGVLQLDRADREDITRRVTSLNVQLGNFGVAGALLRWMINIFTLNEPQLNSDLEHCEQQQYQDAYPPGFEIQADEASPRRCVECMEMAVSSARQLADRHLEAALLSTLGLLRLLRGAGDEKQAEQDIKSAGKSYRTELQSLDEAEVLANLALFRYMWRGEADGLRTQEQAFAVYTKKARGSEVQEEALRPRAAAMAKVAAMRLRPQPAAASLGGGQLNPLQPAAGSVVSYGSARPLPTVVRAPSARGSQIPPAARPGLAVDL